MRNRLAPLALLCALATAAAGDVVVLSDGRKLSGRVTEKKEHYEVVVEGQTLTFAKDDIKQWIKSPREIVGDADRLIAEAKDLYSQGVEEKDDRAAEAKFKQALPKVTKAREAYAEARDLFPEGYPDLDAGLVNVMKLMRLVRERIGSTLAGPAAPPAVVKVKEEAPPAAKEEPKPEPPPAPEFGLKDAWAIVVDPAKRADEAARAQARAFLKKASEARKDPLADLALAGFVYLSRKASLETRPDLQDFFRALGAEGLAALPAKEAVAAMKALAARIRELRSKGPEASVEAQTLFVAGAAASLIARGGGRPPAELEAALKDLDYEKSEFGAVWGRREAIAMDDFRKWVSSGEFALGVVQFEKEYATVADFGPRYALGLLKVFKSVAENRAYNRAASHLEVQARTCGTVQSSHLLALAKSIRDMSPCVACGGSHKVNCSACKGKGKANFECGGCGGSGAVNTFRGVAPCAACKGVGIFKNRDCPKCKAGGKTECKARACREVPPPVFETFADAYKCRSCAGRGTLFKSVAHPCPDCLGVGLVVQPRSDPSKLVR
jgi:hypothetical protein